MKREQDLAEQIAKAHTAETGKNACLGVLGCAVFVLATAMLMVWAIGQA